MLSPIIISRMLSFQVKSEPRAARIPELVRDRGIAPSSTPWGQRYLQKKGSPMPTSFTKNIGRIITVSKRIIYLRYVRGFSLLVESFLVGILCSNS